VNKLIQRRGRRDRNTWGNHKRCEWKRGVAGALPRSSQGEKKRKEEVRGRRKGVRKTVKRREGLGKKLHRTQEKAGKVSKGFIGKIGEKVRGGEGIGKSPKRAPNRGHVESKGSKQKGSSGSITRVHLTSGRFRTTGEGGKEIRKTSRKKGKVAILCRGKATTENSNRLRA